MFSFSDLFLVLVLFLFFFNDTATTEIYTLSLHDALPILGVDGWTRCPRAGAARTAGRVGRCAACRRFERSEEHTSELQSQSNLVCRLLLEKKKMTTHRLYHMRYK